MSTLSQHRLAPRTVAPGETPRHRTATPAPDHADPSDHTDLFERRARIRLALRDADEGTNTAAANRIVALRRELDEITQQLVSGNMGLVRSYARRFSGMASSEDRAEFESAGVLGLMSAVDSYDPGSGTFGQWAFKPIQREVLRAVRDVDHPNLTFGDFEKRPAVLRAFRQLRADDAPHEPSDAEVAAVADVADVTTAQVRRVLVPPRLESANQVVGDGDDTELVDTIESDEPDTESRVLADESVRELRIAVEGMLDERERFVITRRFGLDGDAVEKLAEIGDTLGISRETVRQIESRALAKLRQPAVMARLSGSCDPSPCG